MDVVDDSGTYLAVAFVAGCVAAGTLVRAWALLAAVVLCIVGFVGSGAEALAWLWLFIGLPVLGGAVLLGWALRLVPRRRMWLLPASVAAPALLISAALAARRATLDTVPANVAAQLPRDTGALGVLCIDELPAKERRAARRQVKALNRELPRRSDQLVTVRYALAESPGTDERERTLRELASELLSDNTCSSPEADVLRQALSDAG